MKSALNIFPIGKHDFEKRGYFFEIKTGCPLAPGATLFPFFYAYDRPGAVAPILDFSLQQLNEDATVKKNHILDPAWITTTNNGFHKILMYNSNIGILTYIAEFEPGFYRYYINTGTGRYPELFSEVFEINQCKFISEIEKGAFDSGFDEGFDT